MLTLVIDRASGRSRLVAPPTWTAPPAPVRQCFTQREPQSRVQGLRRVDNSKRYRLDRGRAFAFKRSLA